MILSCESCQTRYLLPPHLIGPEGRKVRCTMCGHEWFQEPEEEGNAPAPDAGPVEPIPEAVRPVPPGSEVPALVRQGAEESASPERKTGVAGWLAGLVVFGLSFAALVVLRGPVASAWPASASLYEAMGYHIPVPGESLIFDRVKASTAYNEQGIEILNVEGRIINLQRAISPLPPVRVFLRGPGGEEGESWVVNIPEKEIAGESEISFHTSYPQIGEDVREATVRFMLAEEPAPPEDASPAPAPSSDTAH